MHDTPPHYSAAPLPELQFDCGQCTIVGSSFKVPSDWVPGVLFSCRSADLRTTSTSCMTSLRLHPAHFVYTSSKADDLYQARDILHGVVSLQAAMEESLGFGQLLLEEQLHSLAA